MWERACSRRRWVSQYMWWLTHRLREQARSHILNRFFQVDRGACIAGKPAPTEDQKQEHGGLKADLSGVKQEQINSRSNTGIGSSVTTDSMCGHWLSCRSWLACDGLTSVQLKKCSPNVGAGLLAKAVGQSIHVVADTPPSRASPLPHFDPVFSGRSRCLHRRQASSHIRPCWLLIFSLLLLPLRSAFRPPCSCF